MANKWDWIEALPDDLDVTQAMIYQEVKRDSPAMLGVRHYVFPDGQVWQQRDVKWKVSIYKPADFDDSRFERIEA